MDTKTQEVITPEVCQSIIRQILEDSTFINSTLEPYSDQMNGYMGNYHLLTIEASTKEKKHHHQFFVKTIRFNNPIIETSRKMVDMYEKEVFIYETLIKSFINNFPQADVSFLPKSYFARNDVLVLEDLKPQGYVQYNSLTFGEAHLKLALKALAKFHSVTLALEEGQSSNLHQWRLTDAHSKNLQEAILRSEPNYFAYGFFQKSIEAFKFISQNLCEDQTSKILNQHLTPFVDNYCLFFQNPNNFRNVCCHGDLWSNNILFKYDGGNPKHAILLDFQFQRYAPPASDVTYLICQTCTKETKEQRQEEYYNYYYSCLGEELKGLGLQIADILPLDEFFLTCKMFDPLARFMKSLYSLVSAISPEYQLKYLKDEDSFIHYVIEDRLSLIRILLQVDEEFKKKIKFYVEDLMEVLETWPKSLF